MAMDVGVWASVECTSVHHPGRRFAGMWRGPCCPGHPGHSGATWRTRPWVAGPDSPPIRAC